MRPGRQSVDALCCTLVRVRPISGARLLPQFVKCRRRHGQWHISVGRPPWRGGERYKPSPGTLICVESMEHARRPRPHAGAAASGSAPRRARDARAPHMHRAPPSYSLRAVSDTSEQHVFHMHCQLPRPAMSSLRIRAHPASKGACLNGDRIGALAALERRA